MTIEQLYEVLGNISDTRQKFKLCKLVCNIHAMEDIVDYYNNSLSAIYGRTAQYFTFNDEFFEEDVDGTIYSWHEDDIVDNYYYPDLIASYIAHKININDCNTKEDVFIKLGIDI